MNIPASLPIEIFYLSALFIPASLFYLVSATSRLQRVVLQFKGFTNSFESIDYRKPKQKVKKQTAFDDEIEILPRGKRKAPYLFWNKELYSIPLEGSVAHTGLPIGKRVQVAVELLLEESIYPKSKSFHIFLYNLEKDDPADDILITNAKQGRWKCALRIKQSEGFEALDEPQLFRLKFRVKATSGILVRHAVEIFEEYEFFAGPDLGDAWLGIDPGTTASCITAGAARGLQHPQEVVIEKENQTEKIVPSRIVFRTNETPEGRISKSNIPGNLYYLGEAARAHFGDRRFRSFQSIKKLLGYKDEQHIEFADKQVLSLSGKELTSLLVKGIYENFQQYIVNNPEKTQHILDNGRFDAKRAVVAIPNNFSAPQIQDMLDSVRSLKNIQEVRYVYEAEATLLYCLRYKMPDFKSGNILIFDMGGATINATLVNARTSIKDREPHYHIEILGKIGYGVGGDSIDYCLGRILYRFHQQYPIIKQKYPFAKTANMTEAERKEQMDLRVRFQQYILDWKKTIVKNRLNQKENLLEKGPETLRIEKEFVEKFLEAGSVDTAVREDFLERFYHAFQKDSDFAFLEDEGIQNYVYRSVADATTEILHYLDKPNIDAVIFSGRSVYFPLIKKNVIHRIKKHPTNIKLKANFEVPFDGLQEAKTAVAKGACLYGLLGSNITLVNQKTYSSYGFTQANGMEYGKLTFTELVKMGENFNQTLDELNLGMSYAEGRIKGLKSRFGMDGNRVNFYQVMGRNAAEIIKEGQKHRFSKIASVPVTGYVDQVAIRVFENDWVHCAIREESGHNEVAEPELGEQKIANEHEDHYTWLLQ